MKRLLIVLALLIIVLTVGQQSRFLPELDLSKYLNVPKPSQNITLPENSSNAPRVVTDQEEVITTVVENSLPSVVTVGIQKTTTSRDRYQIDPFNPFGGFRKIPGQKQNIDQNIGSGFIITADGLLITNKHVVSDTEASYTILTNDKKEYKVEQIYRDPLNDLAILKVNTSGLKPLKLGDSSKLKLGQLAIAIGTPLGEFTNTVTEGIVSGLGRGITAGSAFEGSVEKLDNVIQTDAPINPGNSGGPLLNSNGEVIGVNTAVAQEGQNIGFAIPVNVIKELIASFNKNGGSFERPIIGVRYKMIDKNTALLNDVVEGAYVTEVVEGSPAEKAGIQAEDIITEFDKQKVKGDDDQGLAKLILQKKVGDSVSVKIWRNEEIKTFTIQLESGE